MNIMMKAQAFCINSPLEKKPSNRIIFINFHCIGLGPGHLDERHLQSHISFHEISKDTLVNGLEIFICYWLGIVYFVW